MNINSSFHSPFTFEKTEWKQKLETTRGKTNQESKASKT